MEGDLPSVSEVPPSSPWEPALELEEAQTQKAGKPWSPQVLRYLPVALGSPLGDPAPFYPPSRGYPRSRDRDRELRAPPELLPTPWPTTTAETWEPAQQVRTGASLGAGPGTETRQPPPPRPGLANGRQGERGGGRTWVGAVGSHPQLGALPASVWKGLRRQCQGQGQGGQAISGKEAPSLARMNRSKALMHSLAGDLAEFPKFLQELSSGATT